MAFNFVVVIVTTSVLLAWVSQATGQTAVCTFAPNSLSNFSFQATAEVNREAVSGTSPAFTLTKNNINSMGVLVDNGGANPNINIMFNVYKYDTVPSPDQVNISLILTNLEPADSLTLVVIQIDLRHYLDALWDKGVPAGAYLVDKSYLEYNASTLAASDSISIHFLAVPTGDDGIGLPDGMTEFYAAVSFTYAGTQYGTVHPAVCLERQTTKKGNVFYEQGFTALTFFVMFFVGVGLAVLAVWLFLYIKKRRGDATVSPSSLADKRFKEKGRKIVLDAKAAMRKGVNAIKDFSLIAWNDSFIFVLALKDKLQMHREIDNLDILSTILVDTDLEAELTDASVQACLLTVQGLQYNGDITKASEDKAYSDLQNRLKELDKKLDTEYKKELESVYTDIEAKNKEKLGDLLKKHTEEKNDIIIVFGDLLENEKKQMMNLLDQQHETEENELTYKLALDQNEEAEKLRKEFSVCKRMGVKEIQQQFLENISLGQLNSQKAEWLINHHKKQQEEIISKYDDEISQQRMCLEEKLSRRKALALASETQDDDNVENLNMMASLQLKIIEKMQKLNKSLSADKVREYMDQAKLDLQAVKEKMDKERDIKQQEMFKRLSQVKKKTLADKMSQHAAEFRDFINRSKAEQTEGPVDPISYVDSLIKLKSKHRKEINNLENEIDEAQARELKDMKNRQAKNAMQELKVIEKHLVEKLKQDGMANDVIDKVLRTHEKSMGELTAKQLLNKQNQETKLKDEMAKKKREWEERRRQEKLEQQELREYETEIMNKLLCSQISLSEAEQDKIMKEHEKQMVKLENSLTLNKLRQKRLMEEKIEQRRAHLMDELREKQRGEILKHRKTAENNGEEDDEKTHQKEIMLMRKHVDQRMALIQGMNCNIEQELKEIEIDMLKERALALKDQESRLGALITSLQMIRAREIVQLESQQQAINTLKANLMDDLHAHGILSTSEIERILNIHEEEQDRLSKKLSNARAKQEKILRMELKPHMKQKEDSILQKQELEIRAVMDSATNKSSAKIKHVLLIHKQMVEMEKFRNKLDREISQTLEYAMRDFEIERYKLIQEQEFKFISGLVKVGNFQRNELVDVLHMLFPGKTEEAVTEILNKIHEEKETPQKEKLVRAQSSLAQRIYMIQYSSPTILHGRDSVMLQTSKNSSSSKFTKKDSKMSIISRQDSTRSTNQFGPQDDSAKYMMQNQGRRQGDSTRYPLQNKMGSYESDLESKTTRSEYLSDDSERRISKKQNRYSLDNEYSVSDDEEDEDNFSRRNRYKEEDEEDYIGRGLRMHQKSSNFSGRLPPLREQKKPPGKKKTKLLKKLARQSVDEQL